jgi:ankyrin repeat protein
MNDPKVAGADALDAVRLSPAMRGNERAADLGALALAMWLVDPLQRGDILAHVKYDKTGRYGIANFQCVQFFFEHRSPMSEVWGRNGPHGTFFREAVLSYGMEFSSLKDHSMRVNASNLAAFLRETGLPAIDRNFVMRLIGDVPIASRNAVEILDSLDGSKESPVDLSAEPFFNDEYLTVAFNGMCSPQVRQTMNKAAKDEFWLAKAAVEQDHTEWVRDFLDHGCSVDMRDDYGDREYLIHYGKRSPSVTRLLLERGAQVSVTKKDGKTPLHGGCNGDVTRMLVAAGADLYAEDKDGETPLHNAVRISGQTTSKPGVDKFQAVEALLDCGADPFYVPDDAATDYLTPLQLAVKNGWVDQVDLIMRRREVDQAQRTLAGRTLMQLAGKNDNMKAFLRAAKTGLAIKESLDAKNGANDSAPVPRRQSMTPL